MATLKPQNKGPLYSNTVLGTVAGDGWALTFDTARRGLDVGRARAPPSLLLAVSHVTAHPSTASVPTSYYLMRHYNCLWTLNSEKSAETKSCILLWSSRKNTKRQWILHTQKGLLHCVSLHTFTKRELNPIPRGMTSFSWSGWLVKYEDSIQVCNRSPSQN